MINMNHLVCLVAQDFGIHNFVEWVLPEFALFISLKHTSWIDKIESCFSILVTILLPRYSLSYTSDLKQKILNFIEYFNGTFA